MHFIYAHLHFTYVVYFYCLYNRKYIGRGIRSINKTVCLKQLDKQKIPNANLCQKKFIRYFLANYRIFLLVFYFLNVL